jgi:hypothetical protein
MMRTLAIITNQHRQEGIAAIANLYRQDIATIKAFECLCYYSQECLVISAVNKQRLGIVII